MSIWKIYHLKRYFFLSLLFIVMGLTLLGIGVWVYFLKSPDRWYLYILIALGLYVGFSSYYLLRQSFFQYLPYSHQKGQEKTGIVTYRVLSSPEVSARPLVEIKENGKIHTYLLVGLCGKKEKFEKSYPEGSPAQFFIMDNNDKEALFLSSNR